ncbi:uncharacterized protein LOC118431565 [Branchiostoma floridae]|uniref:Uncharacterized protein LOC118431565 n=1 Tax=Branchiostoma floridae TaxID=7739 RepID=A0A9J7MD94_BRAFL|nr:uncharacterized protein LOC118431565 [Branchiostoma floridae]
MHLCSTTAASTHRSRRSEQRYFSGTAQFSVVIINGTFQNGPPVLLSPLRMSMGEDEGTLTAQLVAKDPEDDDLVFRLNEQQHDTGDMVYLDERGTLRYKPALDFSGSREIPITISESRDDGNPLLSTSLTIVIDVRDENDTPQPFVVHEGEEKLQGSGILHLTVEENHPENVDFEELKFMVGAYDVDAEDAVTLRIQSPSNGKIEVSKHLKNVTFKEPNCSMSVEAKRKEWADAFKKSWAGPAIPYPCGIVLPHPPDLLNWVLAAVTYIPDQHFFGEDTVKFYAGDASGARSKLVTVVIQVRQKPCLNGGRCVGPESDPDCQHQSRSDGFHDFTCNCPVGFEGRHCEINPNDCMRMLDPCPKNYTCIDQVNGYVCHCEPGWPCNGLTLGEIVGITAGCLVALIILIVILKLLIQKHKGTFKVRQSPEESQVELEQLAKPEGQALPAFDNPAYEPTNAADGTTNFSNAKTVWDDEVMEVEFRHEELDEAAPIANSEKMEPEQLLPPAVTGKTAPDDSEDFGNFFNLPGSATSETDR